KVVYWGARDQGRGVRRVGGHMRRGGVGLERLRVAPLFDEDEGVGAEFRLEAADAVGIDGDTVLDAAVFRAHGRNVGPDGTEYGVAHAGLGGDDGEDVDHRVAP